MTDYLAEKAGAAAVDPEDYNAVLDALNDAQANVLPDPTDEGDVLTVVSGEWAGAAPSGGSQPARYDVTLDSSNFPNGGEIVGTGLMMEVGDSIIDIGVSVSADLSPGNDFQFGANNISGVDKVAGSQLNANDPDDGGPYSGSLSAGHFYDLQAPAIIDDVQGRLPCTVKEAHELMVTATDAIEAGSVIVSIYVVRAANAGALDQPAASPRIDSFLPNTGAENDPIVLSGAHFTGTTAVAFGTTDAPSFTVDSDSQITVHVPAGMFDGTILFVTNAAATGPSLTGFTSA